MKVCVSAAVNACARGRATETARELLLRHRPTQPASYNAALAAAGAWEPALEMLDAMRAAGVPGEH